MCQSLPCINSEVQLLRSVTVGGIQVPAGAIGVVRAEDIPHRAITVFFKDYRVLAPQIPESFFRPTKMP